MFYIILKAILLKDTKSSLMELNSLSAEHHEFIIGPQVHECTMQEVLGVKCTKRSLWKDFKEEKKKLKL